MAAQIDKDLYKTSFEEESYLETFGKENSGKSPNFDLAFMDAMCTKIMNRSKGKMMMPSANFAGSSYSNLVAFDMDKRE